MDDATQLGTIIISLTTERFMADAIAAGSFFLLALSLLTADQRATGNVSRRLKPYFRALAILCAVLGTQNAVFLAAIFDTDLLRVGVSVKLAVACIVFFCALVFLATRDSLARVVGDEEQ